MHLKFREILIWIEQVCALFFFKWEIWIVCQHRTVNGATLSAYLWNTEIRDVSSFLFEWHIFKAPDIGGTILRSPPILNLTDQA